MRVAIIVTLLSVVLAGCSTNAGVIELTAIRTGGIIAATAFLETVSDAELADTQATFATCTSEALNILAADGISAESIDTVVSAVSQAVPVAYQASFVAIIAAVLKGIDQPDLALGSDNTARLKALVEGVQSGAASYTRRDFGRFLRR